MTNRRVKQAKAACVETEKAADKAFAVYERAARVSERAWATFMRKNNAYWRAEEKYNALMKMEVV